MLRVGLLCSRRAPGLSYLLGDPNRGSLYQLVCCLTSEEDSSMLEEAKREGVISLAHPIRPFYRGRSAPLGDLGLRSRYDLETAEILARFKPDLLVLAGYLYILTAPLLSRYPERVLNVHASDLRLTDGHGRPRYVGLRSVRDALFSGERETRATLHLVTEKVDAGPPLLRSTPFPVPPLVRDGLAWRAVDMLKAYAFAHQEWMLRAAWGPLLGRAIELIATERVHWSGATAFIDHIPGPWTLRLVQEGSVLVPPPRELPLAVGAWGK